MEKRNLLIIIAVSLLPVFLLAGQNRSSKISAGKYPGKMNLDGRLTEPFWQNTDSINGLTMVEPEENAPASRKTIVKVAADNENIVIGIICYDSPEKITAFTKARDERLRSEDNIKLVFDTFMDKRTGYIFSVNPFGARYDALIADRGEGENRNWDGIWNAVTYIGSYGWSAEFLIPVKTLGFKEGLKEWGFNVERKIQRLLEVDRWTGLKRDYRITNLVQAGTLTDLPEFDLGLGLVMRFSPQAGFHGEKGSDPVFDRDISGDVTKRLTSDISAVVTVNTDFAETEVDARRTNLTRFPLFFPEKRTFFLQGSDIYDFGVGLGYSVIPFFSRKIGLYEGQEIPIIFGTKLNGKVGKTNFGALFVRTDGKDTLVPPSNMAVVRVKQNIWKQSNFGIIATLGDPSGLKDSWLVGGDFTYQISDLFGDKNFIAGVWGLYNNRPALEGNKGAFGLKLDYPNDLFDISLTYRFIGDGFDPSLGFVPRKGIKSYRFGFDYMPRPEWKIIRQFFFESSTSLTTGLDNRWQSYSVFTAPLHFLLESGDRFEFNIRPTGERLTEPFEIEDNVIIPVGEYNFMRYRLELETASKRPVNGQITWWFGSFYSGTLDQIELSLGLRFTSNIILNIGVENNIARLAEGSFRQELYNARLQLNFTPNIQLSSFIQYDNDSRQLGSNTRMRWTITPLIDLYMVYNHNINKITRSRWEYDSNQLTVKLSYGLWY